MDVPKVMLLWCPIFIYLFIYSNIFIQDKKISNIITVFHQCPVQNNAVSNAGDHFSKGTKERSPALEKAYKIKIVSKKHLYSQR